MLKEYYFRNPSVLDFYKLSRYNYVQNQKYYFGFFVEKFSTILIDLDQDLTLIRKQFRSNYRNEIKRAKASNAQIDYEVALDEHFEFYNRNNSRKNHAQLGTLDNECAYVALNCRSKGVTYASHLYLVTKSQAVLMSSCTLNTMDKESFKFAGYCNKFLHDGAIEYFRECLTRQVEERI